MYLAFENFFFFLLTCLQQETVDSRIGTALVSIAALMRVVGLRFLQLLFSSSSSGVFTRHRGAREDRKRFDVSNISDRSWVNLSNSMQSRHLHSCGRLTDEKPCPMALSLRMALRRRKSPLSRRISSPNLVISGRDPGLNRSSHGCN